MNSNFMLFTLLSVTCVIISPAGSESFSSPTSQAPQAHRHLLSPKTPTNKKSRRKTQQYAPARVADQHKAEVTPHKDTISGSIHPMTPSERAASIAKLPAWVRTGFTNDIACMSAPAHTLSDDNAQVQLHMPASAQTPSDDHEPAETRMSVSVQTHTDANAEGETRTLSASAQTPSDNNAQVETCTSASAQTPSDDNAPGQQFTSRFPNNAKQYICPHGTPQRLREVHIDEEFGFPTSALEKQAANINTAALLKGNDCKWNHQGATAPDPLATEDSHYRQCNHVFQDNQERLASMKHEVGQYAELLDRSYNTQAALIDDIIAMNETVTFKNGRYLHVQVKQHKKGPNIYKPSDASHQYTHDSAPVQSSNQACIT
jgi:hypothetical protein